MRLLAPAAIIVFTVFVTVFAASANPREVRVLPRALWVLICLLVTPIGGIVYLLIGRPGAAFGEPRGAQTGKADAAPDDDENFLRDLDRHIRSEREKRGEHDD